MTEAEIASYKQEMFGSNGQSHTQPQPQDTPDIPAEEKEETVVIENTTPVEPTPEPVKEEVVSITPLVEEPPAPIVPAPTKEEIKFANEQSRKLFEAIKEGKDDVVYEILDTKKKLSRASSMSAADAIKLHIEQTNKHNNYTPEDVADIFEEKYSLDPKPIQTDLEDEPEFAERMAKWEATKAKVDRRLERDAVVAKAELAKLNQELVLPDIEKPKETNQVDEAELQRLDKETREAYAKFSEKDIKMNFEFNDEASKLKFNINFTPDKESFDKAIANASDLQTYFANYYGEDGSPKRKEFLRDLYAGQNINKIVAEVAKQASNQTKAWFLKTQKNIGDGTQRNYVVPPVTDIEKLKQAVFG